MRKKQYILYCLNINGILNSLYFNIIYIYIYYIMFKDPQVYKILGDCVGVDIELIIYFNIMNILYIFTQ